MPHAVREWLLVIVLFFAILCSISYELSGQKTIALLFRMIAFAVMVFLAVVVMITVFL